MVSEAYRQSSFNEASQSGPVAVSWSGSPWSMAGLCFLNVVLIVLTLGIYWFWARTEYRRIMWRMVRIESEPLEYTGTGRELLLGYLLLFAVVFLPAILLAAGAQLAFGPAGGAVVQLVLYVLFIFLYFAGVFRAHRYLLSRTNWRGISLGLGGHSGSYAWFSIWTGILISFTLGWLIPWRTTALRRRLTNAMAFGTLPFRFEGSSKGLYGPFTLVWFGFILIYAVIGGVFAIRFMNMPPEALEQIQTTGRFPAEFVQRMVGAYIFIGIAAFLIYTITSSWYEARKLNTFAEATRIDGLRGHLTVTAGGIIALTLTNLLIVVLTLGILRPVAQARKLRYIVERFAFVGQADLGAILRGQEQRSLQGAGLEVAFSIDAF